MAFLKVKRNHLKEILPPGDFVKLGVRADYVGRDVITISRGGKTLGQIKKSIGKYIWYSVATGKPEFSAFTREKVLDGLARRI